MPPHDHLRADSPCPPDQESCCAQPMRVKAMRKSLPERIRHQIECLESELAGLRELEKLAAIASPALLQALERRF